MGLILSIEKVCPLTPHIIPMIKAMPRMHASEIRIIAQNGTAKEKK